MLTDRRSYFPNNVPVDYNKYWHPDVGMIVTLNGKPYTIVYVGNDPYPDGREYIYIVRWKDQRKFRFSWLRRIKDMDFHLLTLQYIPQFVYATYEAMATSQKCAPDNTQPWPNSPRDIPTQT